MSLVPIQIASTTTPSMPTTMTMIVKTSPAPWKPVGIPIAPNASAITSATTSTVAAP